MRLISIVMSLAFAVTAGQAAHGQTPGTGNAAAERPGWYLGVGAGPGVNNLKRRIRNIDTCLCLLFLKALRFS